MNELRIQCYLASKEIELAEFIYLVIVAKHVNKQYCGYCNGVFEMNAQEQLYADYFNDEIKFVEGMTDLELAAHREQIEKIAYEARARAYAAKHVQDTRKRANRKNGTLGFETSLHVDQTSTDAINTIKTRQEMVNKERGRKMTREEKTYQKLLAVMSEEDAQALMSPSTILAKVRSKQSPALQEATSQVLGIDKKPTTDGPFKNPFAKKAEPEPEPEPEALQPVSVETVDTGKRVGLLEPESLPVEKSEPEPINPRTTPTQIKEPFNPFARKS